MTDDTTMSGEATPAEVVAQAARHLVLIGRRLRENGSDLPLVYMDEDGAGQLEITLADELYLIAVQLDYEAATTVPSFALPSVLDDPDALRAILDRDEALAGSGEERRCEHDNADPDGVFCQTCGEPL